MSATYKFNCKVVEVLTVGETITAHAITFSADIIKERPSWSNNYLLDMQTSIQGGYQKYLGVDKTKALRMATLNVLNIQSLSLDFFSKFKLQLDIDYDNSTARKKEILKTLGFSAYYADAASGNQESLVSLLNQFKENMTADLETEITTKGMNPAIITGIKTQVPGMSAANTVQEAAKGSKKLLTDAAVNELNDLYKKIIAICKVGRKVFKDDKAKKDLFSFAKTLKALRGANKGGGDNPPPQPPAQ